MHGRQVQDMRRTSVAAEQLKKVDPLKPATAWPHRDQNDSGQKGPSKSMHTSTNKRVLEPEQR